MVAWTVMWELFRDMRNLLGVINMFSILIVMMVSQVYTFVKTYQIVHFTYVVYFIVNYTSINPLQNKNGERNSF